MVHREYIKKEFKSWVLCNLIFPFIAPLVIFYVALLLFKSDSIQHLTWYCELPLYALKILFFKGIYTFLGLSLYFDMFANRKELKHSWLLVDAYYVCLFLTAGSFIWSLDGSFGISSRLSFSETWYWHLLGLLISVFVALKCKYDLLVLKYTTNDNRFEDTSDYLNKLKNNYVTIN
jgi:hypothetical protein